MRKNSYDSRVVGIRLDKNLTRGKKVHMTFNGEPIVAYEGETIAAALASHGYLTTRSINSEPLGVFCNIGQCHSCVMTVNDEPSVRICMTLVHDGCKIETQKLMIDR